MNEKKYLTEENYKKGKKVITLIAVIVLILGLLLGGSLIFIGLSKSSNVNSKYSDSSKENVKTQLDEEKKSLEKIKSDLESKGVTYDSFTKYSDGESYILKVITEVLDPSFSYCDFDEYSKNSTTSKYCSLKILEDDLGDDFNKSFESFDSIPYYMFGGFFIVATLMVSGSIFMISKRREMLAFTAQQVMPVAKESIDEMGPTVGKFYGNVAKEVSKGIKEGLKDEDK